MPHIQNDACRLFVVSAHVHCTWDLYVHHTISRDGYLMAGMEYLLKMAFKVSLKNFWVGPARVTYCPSCASSTWREFLRHTLSLEYEKWWQCYAKSIPTSTYCCSRWFTHGYCWRYMYMYFLAWGYNTWRCMVLNNALLINIVDGLWSILQVIFLQNVLQFVKVHVHVHVHVFIDCLQRGT